MNYEQWLKKMINQPKMHPHTGHILNYMTFRKMTPARGISACHFLITELSEVLDLLLRRDATWTRNNKKEADDEALIYEIGDCYMMLRLSVWSYDGDFDGAMTISENEITNVVSAIASATTLALVQDDLANEKHHEPMTGYIYSVLRKLATPYGISPFHCLILKMESKGYKF